MKDIKFYKGHRLICDCLGNWYCEFFKYQGKLSDLKKHIDKSLNNTSPTLTKSKA